MIYFITGNIGKYREFKEIIPNLEMQALDLPEIQSLNPEEIISTKLQYASRQLDENIIVEDGYFNILSLNGLPGPLIKWFEKSIGNNGLVKICELYNDYRAEVGINIGLKEKNGTIKIFSGSQSGIVVKPRGTNGFGWDSIFQPDGFDKTYAEMTSDEKNAISMRRIAAQKLKDYLQTHDSEN